MVRLEGRFPRPGFWARLVVQIVGSSMCPDVFACFLVGEVQPEVAAFAIVAENSGVAAPVQSGLDLICDLLFSEVLIKNIVENSRGIL